MLNGGKCEIDAKVGEERLFVDGAPLTGWQGTHTREGIFIAHGPMVKSGVMVDNASILDVTPTLLHSFGIPIPNEMDGRIIKEIFRENYEVDTKNVVNSLKEDKKDNLGLDEEEKALIEERLRKLGYF
jgi:arylsulfatase A-like enzyme